MRSRYTLLVAALGVGVMAGTCQPTDKVLFNLGFYLDSAILQARSQKYEAGGPGWWSWLPVDTAMDVTCGLTTGERVMYAALFQSGDDHLGYSWEETVATVNNCDRYYDPDCEFVVQDEELCDHVGLPWVDVTGAPHPSSGCEVRRGGRPDQGTRVMVQITFPPGDPMNTCADDCDFNTEAGFCWAQFAHP